MSGLKQLFKFYINSSIHVSLVVVCLSLITIQNHFQKVQLELLGFIFLGTITGYNFVKYAGIAKLHHRSLTDSLKVIQIFSFLCFGGLIYFLMQLEWRFLTACIPIGLLTFFYAVPLLPNKNNLRTLPSIKIFVIAAVWSMTTVYLPAVFYAIDWNWDLYLSLLQRFILVLILIIPFEIRDLKYDSSQLGTLPQLLGIKRTKLLAYGLILIYGGIELLKDSLTANYLISQGVMLVMCGLSVYFSKKNQSQFFASFWVEGIPIMWWFILWLIG